MAEIVRIQVVREGWSTFRLLDIRLDSGDVVERSVEDHGDCACVLPYDPERRMVLLARQLRPPALFRGEGTFLEPPAGLIDPGETADVTARREVLEETGVRLGDLEALGTYWATPGASTERCHLFLASYAADDRIEDGGGADEHEDIEIVELSFEDLAAAVDGGELKDLKLFSMALSLMRRRPELFR